MLCDLAYHSEMGDWRSEEDVQVDQECRGSPNHDNQDIHFIFRYRWATMVHMVDMVSVTGKGILQ